MTLLALTMLYSSPGETGSSTPLGLGVGDRYNHLPHDRLAAVGLLGSVASGTMAPTLIST
jgi:hypothetical protein